MIIWLERWGKWCCIFIFNICLPFILCFLTLSSILIFVVWLLKMQWLYQVLNGRVLLPFNYRSCWGSAGQSCESSNHVLLQDLMRTVPKRSLYRTGQTRMTAKCPVCCSEMKFHDQLLWSQCWLSSIFLFLLEGHIFHSLYKVVSYYFLQIFNFVVSFAMFTSFHIIPCYRQPVHLYTRFRCTIWDGL